MQNKSFSTKTLLNTGLAVITLLAAMFISDYLPFIGVFLVCMLSLPVVLVYAMDGLKYAAAALILSIILSGLLIGPITGILIILFCGIVGLTFGYCIRHHVKAVKSYFYVAIAFFISFAAMLMVLSFSLDTNGIGGLVDIIVKGYNSNLESAKQFYISVGVNKQQLDQMIPLITREAILWVLPASLILCSMGFAYFNYKFTTSVFRRLKIEINELRGFEYIYIPNLLAAAMVALTCIGIILKTRNLGMGNYIFTSTWVVFQTALLVEGLSAVSYVLINKFKTSRGIIILLIILSVLVLRDVYIFVGIAELIFDFRKLDPVRIKK